MPDPAHSAIHAAHWHGETAAVWRERWSVPDLRIFRSVGSTNDVARALAEASAPAGTVVLADEQTRGRGRRGRAWQGSGGQSLLLSMVLRPTGESAGVLPLRVGLAVARAIEASAGTHVGIKWPNDLLAGGRKLGGVLCEGALEGDRGGYVVAGIGLNVLQEPDGWPPELRGAATSLAAETGRAFDMPALAARVISEVSMAAAAGPRLDAAELRALERRDVLRGRDVTVDGRAAGRAAGIDDQGALLVRTGDRIRRVITGTIRFADTATAQEGDEA